MPPVPTGTALDAVNEALGLTGDEAHVEPPEDDAEIDGGEGDADESGEGGAEGDAGDEETEGDEESAEGDEETDEEKAARTAEEEKQIKAGKGERNPDGTFKKKEVKAPDPINDPIPKDLKKETSERMQSLIATAKTLTAERDEVRSQFDTIINGIRATGSTPEQYGETISWLSLFNNPAPEAQRAAYDLIEQVAERMSTMLGIDRAVQDPIAKHEDLRQAVATGKITPQYAREIARTRAAQGYQREVTTTVQTQEQQRQQAEQEDAQARADLTAFEKDRKANDPLYQRKRDQIVPALQVTFKRIPKSQWAEAFKEAYNNVKVKPLGKPTGVPNGNNQPMRGGKSPAGGKATAPGSMLDAINGALNGMGK